MDNWQEFVEFRAETRGKLDLINQELLHHVEGINEAKATIADCLTSMQQTADSLVDEKIMFAKIVERIKRVPLHTKWLSVITAFLLVTQHDSIWKFLRVLF